MVGCNPWTIFRFENGIHTPKPQTMRKIERVLADVWSRERLTGLFQAAERAQAGQASSIGKVRQLSELVKPARTGKGNLANARLAQQNTHLQQQIVDLKKLVANLERQVNVITELNERYE